MSSKLCYNSSNFQKVESYYLNSFFKLRTFSVLVSFKSEFGDAFAILESNTHCNPKK